MNSQLARKAARETNESARKTGLRFLCMCACRLSGAALAGYRSLRHPVRAASLTSGNGRGVRDYARRGRLDLRLGGRRQNVASNMAKTVTTSRRSANIRKVSMARLPE